MDQKRIERYAFRVGKMALLPSLVYLVCFCALTYPLITQFSTHLFADKWDGVQNLWNLWWVNKSLVELGQSPWHTFYLHHPYGVSLLSHTLNPFNGLLGIVLLRFCSLVQVYNLMVLFSFTASGLTAFWLADYFTRAYWPSIIGGAIFTFSSYHFAHYEGHLNLISLEWIPLFALCWYILLTRPGFGIAVASSLTLLAVIACDYYYFFYCLLLGFIMFCRQALRSKDVLFIFRRTHRHPFTVFLVLSLATSAPLVISLLLLSWSDSIGGHPAAQNSMDALAPFIPGSHWRFSHLTESFWKSLPGDPNGTSVYVGLSVFLVLLYVWINRRSLPYAGIRLWYVVFVFFAVLALGPTLHVWGKEVPYTQTNLPYGVLERLFPPIKVSGVPGRMLIMSTLAASVLCAMGLSSLLSGSRRTKALAAVFLLLLTVESLPKRRVSSLLSPPEFARVLKSQAGEGGILDSVHDPFEILYHQTIHEKPIAFGVLSRIPASVEQKDRVLMQTFQNGEYEKLNSDYRIRYLIMSLTSDLETRNAWVKTIYQDTSVKVYDLGEIPAAIKY